MTPAAPHDSDGARRWIFGYGSLMWRPGFAYAERRPALLSGHRRAFCRLSFRHRGTPERPGMVVGLVPGGDCRGMAFLPQPGGMAQVLDYLDEREGAGYLRTCLPLTLLAAEGERTADAWVYLPNPAHSSYQPELPWARMVELIAHGSGESGQAVDYLRDLLHGLEALDAGEPWLRDMLRDVERRLNGAGTGRAAAE
jgi:cation transport protein ChaC